MRTYNVPYTLRKNVENLGLLVLEHENQLIQKIRRAKFQDGGGGGAYCSFRAVKKYVRQFVQDDQSEVKNSLDMPRSEIMQSVSNALVYPRCILFVQAVPLGESGDDCLLV